MSATREIFVKEIADSLVSRKAWMVVVLCCTLIPLSLLIHHSATEARQIELEQIRQEYEETQELIPQRFPAFAGKIPADELEVKVFRQPPELTAFGTGLDSGLPELITLDLDSVTVEMGQVEASTSRSLLGRIDLLFLVQFLLALVAVVLSFDLICGEREAGTLKLILVNPVTRGRILWGKLASVLLLLAVPFTVGLALGLLLLRLIAGWHPAGPESWLRIAGLYVLSLLYLGVFVHLGAWLSSLTSRSLTALVVLLFIWVTLTAILPQSAGLVAEAVYPAESEVSVLQKKSRLREEQLRRQMEELRPLADREDYEQRREEIADRYERQLGERLEELDGDLQRQRETQNRIAFGLAALSPAASLGIAWTALTGTGPAEAHRFFSDVSAYQDRLQATVFGRTFRDLFDAGQARGRIQLVDPQEIPELHHRPLTLNETLRQIWPHFLLLVVLNVIPAVGAYLAFSRYDVR